MTEPSCQKCRNWLECPFNRRAHYYETDDARELDKIRKGWYHYGEIRWCPFQVIWILQNADILHSGQWPPEHIESGGATQLKSEGNFVKAKIVIGELEKRMKTTGMPGKFLRAQIEAGRTLDTLDPEAREVVMYLKGRNRKKMAFLSWRRWKRAENRRRDAAIT